MQVFHGVNSVTEWIEMQSFVEVKFLQESMYKLMKEKDWRKWIILDHKDGLRFLDDDTDDIVDIDDTEVFDDAYYLEEDWVWFLWKNCFYFRNEEDALMFKLTYVGEV